METTLDFVLKGAGWASLQISADSFNHEIGSISYLSNALDDLLRMGIDIATDKGWTFAQFDHEPSTTVLVAETGWWENDGWVVGARLSSIRDSDVPGSGITWNVIHKAKRDFVVQLSSRDELAATFLGTAKRVLEVHGEDGYRRSWGGQLGFPMRAMVALETALTYPETLPNNYGDQGFSPQ